MSESEAARVLRIIGKYAWAAADEIDGNTPEPVEDETREQKLERAKSEAAERRKQLGGIA